MSDRQKDLMLDVFLSLGFDEEAINRDGSQSDVIRNNPSFNRAIAEYKYLLLMKEDGITADPTLDRLEANKYREYYSMLRVLLDGLVATLDQKILLLENQQADDYSGD